MRMQQILAAALASVVLAAPGHAADFSDPTWPCIQRKVETLSVGLMWPHPIEEIALSEEVAHDVSELSQRFALRRLEIAEIAPALDAFVAAHGHDEALLGQVFNEVFTSLARTRSAIMTGIADYSLSQIALSERIESARIEMDTALGAAEPDYDRIDVLEEQIDWDERIYNERRQSLTYICETPVLIEKRLFEVAQTLLAAVQDG